LSQPGRKTKSAFSTTQVNQAGQAGGLVDQRVNLANFWDQRHGQHLGSFVNVSGAEQASTGGAGVGLRVNLPPESNSIVDQQHLKIVRRLTWLLFSSQSISSAGFIAGSTVGTLVGAALSGQAALAGVPGAVYLGGSALAAYPAARFMERVGRRHGLTAGFAVGLTGALIVGAAVLIHNFLVFLAGFVVMGAARGFTDLGRYAAAEMHSEAERGRAISLVVLGGTVGAVVGPALVGPAGQIAERLGADQLAGPWFGSAALFLLGAILVAAFLRPDPSDLARQPADAAARPAGSGGPVRSWSLLLRDGRVQTALGALVLGQAVMVMLMSMTSLHMRGHQHNLTDISLVISSHTLGMFGPSIISGRLVDRWGRVRMIALGAALLVAACLLAPLSPDVVPIGLALFLLGLGWNFCYVAGGTLLTDVLTPAERSRGQGTTDLLINLASAGSSLGSGVLYAALGYTLISWIGLIMALIPLALAVGLWLARRAAPATS
jgi:MFS family permease